MNNEMCGCNGTCGTEEKPSTAKGLVKINYKQDFELVVELLAGDKPYKLGDEDFRIDFIVMASRYTVGRTGGVCERCAVDGNKIRCFMDGHGLPPGELRAEVKVNTSDPNYADGKRLSVAIAEGMVVLVKDNTHFDGAVIKANIPVALVDAYQLAKAHGYKGTIDEYYATFTEVKQVKDNLAGAFEKLEDGRSVVSLITEDVRHGKRALALALTNQGKPTRPTEAIADMADKVQDLRLAVDGEIRKYPVKRGERDLLDEMHNFKRTDLPYMHGVKFDAAHDKVMLAGADAYYLSDGTFITEGGEMAIGMTEGALDKYVIYYHKDVAYQMTFPLKNIETVVVYNGVPVGSLQGVDVRIGEYVDVSEDTTALDYVTLTGLAIDKVAINKETIGARDIFLNNIKGIRTLRLPRLVTCNKNLLLGSDTLMSVYAPKLDRATVSVVRSSKVTDVSFPSLKTISADYFFDRLDIEELYLQNLEVIERWTLALYCDYLTTINLPKLKKCDGCLSLHGRSISEINLPSLESVGSVLVGGFSDKLTSVSVGKLKIIGTRPIPMNFISTTSTPVFGRLSLPSLTSSTFVTNKGLSAVDFGAQHYDDKADTIVVATMNNTDLKDVTVGDGFAVNLDLRRCVNLPASIIKGILGKVKALDGDENGLKLMLDASHKELLQDADVALATAKGWEVTFG